MQLNYISGWLSGDLAKALSWTLIHSLWQGLICRSNSRADHQFHEAFEGTITL